MEKHKKSNRLIFNLLLTGTVIVLLSSCAREKASWSSQNEKLRKYSLEIENSHLTASLDNENPEETTNVVSDEVSNSVPEANESKTVISENKEAKKAEVKKLNVAEKLIVKKLSKKMHPENSEEVKKGGMDQNLRYALIFGVVGIALCILGTVLWLLYLLGTIAILVALVFLVLWLLEQ
jgi:preprotein translocase subunit SecD